MNQIDHSKLRAKPEEENFSGKYESSNPLEKILVQNYFKAVAKLISKTQSVETAHEIGIGEGISTGKIKSLLPKLTGSEYVEKLVPIARRNNPELLIFQESVYDLKYPPESVDLVLLLEVLEHLDHPSLALKEIKRISKKYLIVGVPKEPLWRFLNLCRFKYVRDLGNTPGHLNHWSRSSITKLLQNEYGEVIATANPLPWTLLLVEKKQQNVHSK